LISGSTSFETSIWKLFSLSFFSFSALTLSAFSFLILASFSASVSTLIAVLVVFAGAGLANFLTRDGF
jgi:hypothetical protein